MSAHEVERGLKDVDERIADTKRESDQARADARLASAQVKEHSDKITQIQATLNEAQDRARALEEQLAQQQAQMEAVNREIEAALEDQRSKQEEHAVVTGKLSELKRTAERLKQEMDDIKREEDTLAATIADLQDRLRQENFTAEKIKVRQQLVAVRWFAHDGGSWLTRRVAERRRRASGLPMRCVVSRTGSVR